MRRPLLSVLMLGSLASPAFAQTIDEREARLRALVPFERMVVLSPGVTRQEYDAVMRELAEEGATGGRRRPKEPVSKRPVSKPPVYTPSVYIPPKYTPPVYTANTYTPETFTPERFIPPSYKPETLASPTFAPPPRNPRVFETERQPQWYLNTRTGKVCVLQAVGLVCAK